MGAGVGGGAGLHRAAVARGILAAGAGYAWGRIADVHVELFEQQRIIVAVLFRRWCPAGV